MLKKFSIKIIFLISQTIKNSVESRIFSWHFDFLKNFVRLFGNLLFNFQTRRKWSVKQLHVRVIKQFSLAIKIFPMKYYCYREGNITIFGGIQHFSGQRNTIILFVILFKNRKLNQSIRRNKMRITQFIQKYSLDWRAIIC